MSVLGDAVTVIASLLGAAAGSYLVTRHPAKRSERAEILVGAIPAANDSLTRELTHWESAIATLRHRAIAPSWGDEKQTQQLVGLASAAYNSGGDAGAKKALTKASRITTIGS
jgi:hypothetical protein